MIRGARQVGKSTLVRNFASKMGILLQEINLERFLELEPIFKSLNTTQIQKELSAHLKSSLPSPHSLLFLDEIQATPSAIPALRYLHEDFPDLPIIAAGSLLEFVLSEHTFSMPVGRIEYLHLYPMSFQEFLLGQGDTFLIERIRNYHVGDFFAQTLHQELVRRQREYLFVGGMPEAVAIFLEQKNILALTRIQETILETYQDDFSKYGKKIDPLQLKLVFQRIPALMGQKIKYVHISREEKAKEVKKSITLLMQARVITPVFNSSCSGVPLFACADLETYKLFFLDVGLANRVLKTDWTEVNAMEPRRLINEGSLAEQFVGQHLLVQGHSVQSPRLTYWLREGRANNAEVDYVMAYGGGSIIPIEVKAGKSGALKSLHQFMLEHKSPLAVRFDLGLPQRSIVESKVNTSCGVESVSYPLLSLPLYMVEELPRLLYDEMDKKPSIPTPGGMGGGGMDEMM